MMLFEVGDEVRVRQPTNLFHSELGKVVSIDHVKLTYKVVFHRGNSDVYTCFDLILVKRQEEKVMKFKVGDKVKVSNSWEGRSGEVGEITRRNIWEAYPCRVTFEDGVYESFKEEDLELATEEEKVMKFKVGDKVKVSNSWGGHDGEIGEINEYNKGYEFDYCVTFEGEYEESFREEELELVKEEETSMKFKVGDKVKVSDSWEGRDGEIGQIVDINVYNEFTHEVRFEDMVAECFREEELELVKEKAEKQSFTKSDLKTGMGVVLRDGSKGHLLLDTSAGDVIRLINGENNEWMSTQDYDSEMRDSDMKSLDIMEVYSSRLAYCYVTERLFTASNQVFKREEPKPEPTKMTMKEINEHFGKAIEIIE